MLGNLGSYGLFHNLMSPLWSGVELTRALVCSIVYWCRGFWVGHMLYSTYTINIVDAYVVYYSGAGESGVVWFVTQFEQSNGVFHSIVVAIWQPLSVRHPPLDLCQCQEISDVPPPTVREWGSLYYSASLERHWQCTVPRSSEDNGVW